MCALVKSIRNSITRLCWHYSQRLSYSLVWVLLLLLVVVALADEDVVNSLVIDIQLTTRAWCLHVATLGMRSSLGLETRWSIPPDIARSPSSLSRADWHVIVPQQLSFFRSWSSQRLSACCGITSWSPGSSILWGSCTTPRPTWAGHRFPAVCCRAGFVPVWCSLSVFLLHS